MNSIRCAEERIRSAISKSKVPEDPLHAESVLAWVLKLMPDADEAMKLAALGHDIDRAEEALRVQKSNYQTFDEYKAAHASHSADIIRTILEECRVDQRITVEACRLVRLHEIGGDERSDILKNADSLSFFQDNIPLYFARNGSAETKRRAKWGFARLDPELRKIVEQFHYESKDLTALIQEMLTTQVDGPKD